MSREVEMNPANASKRILSVDIIRILAMLMIIVLHTVLSFTLRPDFFSTKAWFVFEPFVAISKTGVLLFFMLSGFLVINKSRTLEQNLEKTKKRIIIPLLFFTIVNILIELIRYQHGNHHIDFFQSQLTRETGFPSSPLWFLVVLAVLYVLNPFWQIIFSDNKYKSLAKYLVFLTFLFSITGDLIKWPALRSQDFFNNFTGWMGYVFFYLYGGLVSNKWIKFDSRKINWGLFLFGFVTTMVGDFFSSFTAIHNIPFVWNGYFSDFLNIPVVLMSIGIFNLLISSDFNFLRNANPKRSALILVEWVAAVSYGVYLIHTYVITVFYTLGFDFNKLSVNIYLYNILNYALVLGISIAIVYFIKKIPKLRMIIGE